jgi:hypothetical protein
VSVKSGSRGKGKGEDAMFDAVLVKRGGGFAEMSPAEFLGLPLNERVRSLLEHKVEFRKNGTQVPAMDVLKSLMAQAAAGPR